MLSNPSTQINNTIPTTTPTPAATSITAYTPATPPATFSSLGIESTDFIGLMADLAIRDEIADSQQAALVSLRNILVMVNYNGEILYNITATGKNLPDVTFNFTVFYASLTPPQQLSVSLDARVPSIKGKNQQVTEEMSVILHMLSMYVPKIVSGVTMCLLHQTIHLNAEIASRDRTIHDCQLEIETGREMEAEDEVQIADLQTSLQKRDAEAGIIYEWAAAKDLEIEAKDVEIGELKARLAASEAKNVVSVCYTCFSNS
jgi:hypothetical protein